MHGRIGNWMIWWTVFIMNKGILFTNGRNGHAVLTRGPFLESPGEGPDTRCNIAHNIARNGWIASCIHPKICCTQYCVQYYSSRISSYFCNICAQQIVSTICSISCNSVTQISVFSQSNLTFKFNHWPNFRPWYVSRKKLVWSAEEESSLIDYYRGK